MSAGRGRLLAACVAAFAGGAAAAVVLALTDPYEAVSSEDYQEVVRIGLVLRYALLAGAATWLVLRLVHARREGRRRVALFSALALVVVAALAAVAPLVEDRRERVRPSPERRSDLRVEFMDGCSRRQPVAYCECLYEAITARGGEAALADLAAGAQATRAARPALRRAVDRCLAATGPPGR